MTMTKPPSLTKYVDQSSKVDPRVSLGTLKVGDAFIYHNYRDHKFHYIVCSMCGESIVVVGLGNQNLPVDRRTMTPNVSVIPIELTQIEYAIRKGT